MLIESKVSDNLTNGYNTDYAQAVEFKPEERQIVLTMNVETASLLYELLHHVGGSPQGPRGNFDSIRMALFTANVPRNRTAHLDIVRGSIFAEKA